MTSPTQTAPTTRSPRQSVQRAADIARRYGLEGAADHARNLLDAKFRRGTVVVVGEVKRGKSSLVNALFGRRDLLPVDVLTCTAAPIRVTVDPEADPQAAPLVRLVRGERRDEITVGELPRWVTVGEDGRGVVTPDGDVDQIPSAAEISLGDRRLPKVTIIDTPGVGGLDEHAVTAALHEARGAGLLLMVCDASTPITAPEMEILRTARESTGGVVVAVTKTDKNVRRWRSIVEDDRRLIEQHLGVSVPVIGVSSLRAADAAEHPDPERAAAIDERSGIAELRRVITDFLRTPQELGERAALESVRATLHGIHAGVDKDLRLHTEPSKAVEELEAEKTELEQFREQSSEWEQLFQRDIQVTRNRITDQLDQDLEAMRVAWTQRIEKESLRVLRSKPQVFTSQIEAELADIMERTIGQLLDAITSHARNLFPDNPETAAEITASVLETLTTGDVSGREVDKKTKNLLDPSVVMMGMLGAGLLAPLIPVAPLAGGVWIGVNMAYRAMRNGKQHLVTWLRETSGKARQSTTRIFDTVIASARTEIMLKYRSDLRRRQKELQTRIEEARQLARESEAGRKEKVVRLQKNAEIIRSTMQEIDRHLAAAGAGAAGAGVDAARPTGGAR